MAVDGAGKSIHPPWSFGHSSIVLVSPAPSVAAPVNESVRDIERRVEDGGAGGGAGGKPERAIGKGRGKPPLNAWGGWMDVAWHDMAWQDVPAAGQWRISRGMAMENLK